MTILNYIQEECDRQGHQLGTVDGLSRSLWMMNAWRQAQQWKGAMTHPPSIEQIVALGTLIEPEMNKYGIRVHRVMVGSHICPSVHEIQPMLEELWPRIGDMAPIDAYRAFETIHPFGDGNGRTGKILLNWLNDTLDDPIFPPANLWGMKIRNP